MVDNGRVVVWVCWSRDVDIQQLTGVLRLDQPAEAVVVAVAA